MKAVEGRAMGVALPSTAFTFFVGHRKGTTKPSVPLQKFLKKVMSGVEGRTSFVQKWPKKVKDTEKVPMAWSYLLGGLHFFWELLHKTCSSFDAQHHFFW